MTTYIELPLLKRLNRLLGSAKMFIVKYDKITQVSDICPFTES